MVSKDRESCLQLGRTLIQSSINSHYRNRKDWEDYFRRRKAISSGEVGDWIMNEIGKEFISPQQEEVPSADIILTPAVAEEHSVVEEPKYTENSSDYLLPIIKNKGINDRSTYRNAGYNINHNLKRIAEKAGIGVFLTLCGSSQLGINSQIKGNLPLGYQRGHRSRQRGDNPDIP